MSLVEIIWLFGSILFFPLFFRLFHFFYRLPSYFPLQWTLTVFGKLVQFCRCFCYSALCAGGSMFFSEQLRKFWSQKRANTSSDGLFSLYRAKVRTFAASLEAAEAVRKTDKDQSIQCTMDRKNRSNLGWLTWYFQLHITKWRRMMNSHLCMYLITSV